MPSFVSKDYGNFHIKFTPEFWEEYFFNWIFRTANEREFIITFGNKIITNFEIKYDIGLGKGAGNKRAERIAISKLLAIGTSMYKHRKEILQIWEESDKKHRILIKFNFLGDNLTIAPAEKYEAKYLGSEIIYNDTRDYRNFHLERLRYDLQITDKSNVTNLGLINNNNESDWNGNTF